MKDIETTVALITTGGVVFVAILGIVGKWLSDRRKEKTTKLDLILSTSQDTNHKVDLISVGTKEALKTNLLRIYEEEHLCVTGQLKNRAGKKAWCRDKDEVFREVYKAYKNLQGNGIIDSLLHDMDIWRDKFAENEFNLDEDPDHKRKS